jgi:phosphoribosylanthranilate isomerase
VLQLHGDETPDYCGRLSGWPLIKAVRVGAALDAAGLEDYEVQAFLLDARDGALYGGTGKVWDWSLAAALSGRVPVILAGGLRPDNVAEAIRTARPYGVDVSSGVESSPGRKDRALVRAFIEEVRNACNSI